ncbi:MAG: MetQ/NlpA family ABC transporter substrate-binding protein [Aristaeellaceae bacterium]
MKKFLSLILAALLVLSATAALADTITIAVPNDPTNEGRALLLLQANGYIKLDPNAGVTATAKDIVENPLNIQFKEVEAAMVPNVLADVDYAIINNNFALDYGLNPVADSLLIESAESPYANVLCVNAGNEDSDAAKALAAALNSQQVADFITAAYNGAAVSVVAEPTDGYDATVDYEKLAGTTITVAASPTPHAQILAVAADILAAKNVILKVIEFSDYVQPNMVVDAGEVFANYFAHIPYQENFNAENGTNIVIVAPIHVEPMGLYGGKQTTLDALNAK